VGFSAKIMGAFAAQMDLQKRADFTTLKINSVFIKILIFASGFA
jgi:hypothetical protein